MTSPPPENVKIKRFGYLLSALLLLLSNIALIKNWQVTPFIFLATMYFLTGALWGPVLIRPFFSVFDKLVLSKFKSRQTNIDKNLFHKN